MTNVLLFDLDGTLLPMDTDQFVEGYVKALAGRVAPYINPELFVKALWKGTHAMIQNTDPAISNQQTFEEEFLGLSKLKREEIWPVFDEFYLNTFPTLSELSKSTPLALQIIEEAVSQGYRVGIATNPVFPRQAIEHRLKWAGVDHIPFEVVTVYEECCFTKPHKEYYEMICQKLQVEPEECIMIGNDVQEDMSARQIGMKTYLVEGYVIDRGEPAYQVDARGTLEELHQALMNKEGLFS